MKKTFLPILFFCLLSMIVAPLLVQADGLVPCDGVNCKIDDFTKMLGGIYTFIVTKIATPLAIIAISIGGILMMISAGNPNLMSLGKKIFWSAVIGLFLVYGSYAIIKLVLSMVGYSGSF